MSAIFTVVALVVASIIFRVACRRPAGDQFVIRKFPERIPGVVAVCLNCNDSAVGPDSRCLTCGSAHVWTQAACELPTLVDEQDVVDVLASIERAEAAHDAAVASLRRACGLNPEVA